MQKTFKTISIVIPVYNEENYITDVLQKIISSDTLGLKKEIIIVDDHSTDKTIQQIKSFMQKNKYPMKLIQKKVNEGKGSSVKMGFMETKGDIVIIQDADLEYNPADYPVLLEPFIMKEADAVFGSRFITNKPHRVLYFWHYTANTFLTLMSNIMTNLNVSDMETGYKAFRGEVIRTIAPRLKSKRFGFEPEITARLAKIKNIKIYEVGISYQGRSYEEGKKIDWKDGFRAIGEIIYFNLFS